MKEIIPFVFDDHQIRVVRDNDGSPLFVGKDICEALGYADANNAMKLHCKGVVKRHPLQTAGGVQQMRVLTEGDMYRLMTHSKLESAERFESLVFDEILPTIRKTGKYEAKPSNEPKQPSGLDKLRIAQAMSLAEETAARICQRFPNLGDNGKQVVYAKILNPFVGDNVIALPRVTSNLLPAGKVGEILGVSGNMIGRLANQNGLKTDEYGEFRLDKSAHSDKQVESFHYNDKAVSVLRDLLSGKEAA